jgi:hypothetical protein
MARAPMTTGLAAGAAAESALAAAAVRRAARTAAATEPAAAAVSLSASDRENPEKLSGADLRALAHRRGVSRSEAEHMPDDKLRMQLRYITNRQYADESA